MKLKRLASKSLATATAFSMATTLFAGVPAVPVNAADTTKRSSFKIEAEYGVLGSCGYGPGDFSNNCSIRDYAEGDTVKLKGITLDEAGTRKVTIYYAAGMETSVTVAANGGTAKTVDLNSTGSWVSKAGSATVDVEFKAGENELVITSGNPGPNLDYVTVEMTAAEEQKTLLGMINSLQAGSLGDSDTTKANALEVAYNSMYDKKDVYIKNSLTEVIRKVNNNSPFTYEAELGSTDGKVITVHEATGTQNKGSNGAMVGLDKGQKVSIKVYKETAGTTQVAVYYAVAGAHRYVACTVNGQENVFSKCAAERTDLFQDGNDDLPWAVPQAQPVSMKIDLAQGWNTLEFAFPNNTAGLDLSEDMNKFTPNLDKFQIYLTAKEEAETIKELAKTASTGGLERAFLSISPDAKALLEKETGLSSSLNTLVKDWSSNKEDSFGEANAKTFTVKFDANGGTIKDEDKTQAVKENKTAKEPEVTRDGYELIGWFEKDAEEAFDFETPIKADMTLKAEWAENTDAADKTIADAQKQLDELNKDDYPADKWDKVQDILDKIAALEDDAYDPATAAQRKNELAKELAAALQDLLNSKIEEAFTVTFLNEDGSVYKTQGDLKTGNKVDEPEAPVKENYDFLGWYTVAGSGADPYAPTTNKYDFANMAITGDLVLIAKFEKNALAEATDKYEAALKDLEENFNKDEYEEDAWKEIEDILAKIEDEYASGAPNADTISVLLEQLQAAKDALADKKKKFTVTYNANGGVVPAGAEKEVVEYGKTVTKLINATRSGYDFAGWVTAEGVAFDFDTPIKADITLTAKWTANADMEAIKNQFNQWKNYFDGLQKDQYDAGSITTIQEIIRQIEEELKKENPDFDRISQLVLQLSQLTSGIKPVNNAVLVSGVTVTADPSLKIAAGKKVDLDAEVAPANATNSNVVWTSSNTSWATVDANGVVTTKKAGKGKKVVITATAADGSQKAASVTVQIMKKAVKKIKITGSNTVTAGKKLKLKATVTPKAKKSQINATLQWVSSNTKYATVNKKGVVKATKKGKGKTVKITAFSTDGTNKKATFKIKIK